MELAFDRYSCMGVSGWCRFRNLSQRSSSRNTAWSSGHNSWSVGDRFLGSRGCVPTRALKDATERKYVLTVSYELPSAESRI